MSILDRSKQLAAHEAIATALSINADEVKSSRFMPIVFNRPALFRVGESVYAAPADNRIPPIEGIRWTLVSGNANSQDRSVYRADLDDFTNPERLTDLAA